jgi:hypothetical protein
MPTVPIANLTTVEAIGLVASVVSIALAIFAIWQASTFYRWSDAAAKEGRDSARDIRASVERIEKLFDTFYSDTFGLMKDTYADFRKHTWPKSGQGEGEAEDLGAAAEEAAAEKIDELRGDLRADLAKLTERGEMTDAAIDNLRRDFTTLLDRAIDQSRRVEEEAEGDVVRPALLRRIEELQERGQTRITASRFVRPILRSDVAPGRAFRELYKLRDEGLVDFEIDTERARPRLPEAGAMISFSFD